MSYTKKRLIDSVRAMLEAHDHKNHPALVEDCINHVYSQLLTDVYQDAHNLFEVYTKNYTVNVSLDGTSARYYLDLPVSVVNLPRMGGGVISIQSNDGTGFRYFPTSEQRVRIASSLESGRYGRYVSWYLNRGRVFFSSKMTAENAPPSVRVSLATQFKDFESTDEIVTPGGKNYDLAQLAFDYISQKSILDLELDKQD